jgi:CRISPR-associated protein Cas1
MHRVWSKDKDLKAEGFTVDDQDITRAINQFSSQIEQCSNLTNLLLIEAQMTKALYKIAANNTKIKDFVRNHENIDDANAFLSHGNYLAYGLAASTLWVLGIPHGFAVLHGKTRRGALVFDIADLIKDTLILPWAFICAKEGATEQEFRQQCLQNFTKHKALDFMFESVKQLSVEHAITNKLPLPLGEG